MSFSIGFGVAIDTPQVILDGYFAHRPAAGVLRAPARDDDALTLQIPTDGNVAMLRRLLHELDDAAVDVDALSNPGYTPSVIDDSLGGRRHAC